MKRLETIKPNKKSTTEYEKVYEKAYSKLYGNENNFEKNEEKKKKKKGMIDNNAVKKRKAVTIPSASTSATIRVRSKSHRRY